MAHDSKAVANYLLDCAREDGETLSPMKLIKLVYLCHGWNLGLTGEPLIRENVEAWRYGPVIPSLYHDLKEFGNQPVTRYASWPVWQGAGASIQEPKLTTATPETIALLRKVWQEYKPYSAVDLSAMTHQPGTPWYVTWHERGGSSRLGQDIDDNLIRDHFRAKAGA